MTMLGLGASAADDEMATTAKVRATTSGRSFIGREKGRAAQPNAAVKIATECGRGEELGVARIGTTPHPLWQRGSPDDGCPPTTVAGEVVQRSAHAAAGLSASAPRPDWRRNSRRC